MKVLLLLSLVMSAPNHTSDYRLKLDLGAIAWLPATMSANLIAHELSHIAMPMARGWDCKIELTPLDPILGRGSTFGMSYATRRDGTFTATDNFIMSASPMIMNIAIFATLAIIRHNLTLPLWLDQILLSWQIATAVDFIFHNLQILGSETDHADSWGIYRSLNGKDNSKLMIFRVGAVSAAAIMATALVFQF